jgi:uncharacterized phage protein (TIGR02218 family)
MTYDATERSKDARRPIEIYLFARGAQTWRFTSADRAVVADTFTFSPRAISRTAIDASAELARAGLTLTVHRDFEIATMFRENPTTAPVTCMLQAYHEGDGEVATMWLGRVSGVSFQGVAATVKMEPVYTSIRRMGLRRAYQRQCPHVLYGTQCGANRELHRVDGTLLDAPDGVVVTVPEAATKPDGWAAGGTVEYVTPGGVPERRFILNHVSTELTLSALPHELHAGMDVKIYAGCEHTIEVCDTKFSNAVRYGGMPYFTKKNPFGGDPIY